METLDIAPLMVWAAVVLTLLNLGTTVWALLNSGAKQNEEKISKLNATLDQTERRLARVEDQVGHMPSTEMLQRLELSLERMEGHINVLDERLKPVAAIAERMQELMLEQARSR
jgi:predicted  nucleic acid-binding Zn-ribbon protein